MVKSENPVDLYSNQFIPLWFETDLFTKVKVDSVIRRLSGGGISHINIERELTVDQLMAFIKYAAKQGLEHYAFNPFVSRCSNGHIFLKRISKCPICGSTDIQAQTRVVGYYTLVESWKKERRDEYKKRAVIIKEKSNGNHNK